VKNPDLIVKSHQVTSLDEQVFIYSATCTSSNVS
jgi:hypothetical protein